MRVDSSVRLIIWKRTSMGEGGQQCQVNNMWKRSRGTFIVRVDIKQCQRLTNLEEGQSGSGGQQCQVNNLEMDHL